MKLATRSNFLGILAGLLTIVLAAWGRYRDWYWYDNLAHFTGGLSLGSLAASEDSTILQDILIVTVLSTMWEVFEYYKGVYPWNGEVDSRIAAEDTLLDGYMVSTGAYLGSKSAKVDNE